MLLGACPATVAAQYRDSNSRSARSELAHLSGAAIADPADIFMPNAYGIMRDQGKRVGASYLARSLPQS